jgi:Hpt domain
MLASPGTASPAEIVSDQDPPTGFGLDPPLDLVHLARHCLGDHELEDELLGLFRLQSLTLVGQLSDSSLLSLESKANIAHKLHGSALAVGAGRVASASRRVEEFATAAGDRALPGTDEYAAVTRAIAVLISAVAEAVAEIERIRG